ncbi:hypothetical protein DMN91_012114 [Ooceraea biroi]|uniref:Integrase zinc-binding domain-containing protein n=1 Tax=Ooceraea biroi TaxID=2015173 RepID=A0A3L8D7U6_OOCBI|nr:hypothetical protein DMN91_012114 [Ooceraea biroi]
MTSMFFSPPPKAQRTMPKTRSKKVDVRGSPVRLDETISLSREKGDLSDSGPIDGIAQGQTDNNSGNDQATIDSSLSKSISNPDPAVSIRGNTVPQFTIRGETPVGRGRGRVITPVTDSIRFTPIEREAIRPLQKITVIYCLPNGRTVTEEKFMSTYEYGQLLRRDTTSNPANNENIIRSQDQDSFQIGIEARGRDMRNIVKFSVTIAVNGDTHHARALLNDKKFAILSQERTREYGLHHVIGKREQPSVIAPPVTALKGVNEAKTGPASSTNKERVETEIKLDQTKVLDKTPLNVVTEPSIASENDLSTNNRDTSFLLDVSYETEDEIELTEYEIEIVESIPSKENPDRTKLSMFSCKDLVVNARGDPEKIAETKLLKSLESEILSPQIAHQLTKRRIFCSGNGTKEPVEVVKIPVEISTFGETLKGIIDSGSERSYLSKNAYERIKSLQVNSIVPDSTSTAGVCLGDNSLVKTEGGTYFVIDIGDVYGPQWFSVLPGLSDWYEMKRKLVNEQPDRFPDWKVENDELMYYRPDFAKAVIDDENPWKRVVKPSETLSIIQENHDQPQAGHLGRDKTLDHIRQNYYWPGMSRDVKSYLEDCETCLKIKDNQNPLKGSLVTRSLQFPWAQLPVANDVIDDWVERINKIDELRHTIKKKLKDYSEKRLAKLNSERVEQVPLKVGMEVYYPNKKLSSKSESYNAKLAHRYVGPAIIKRILGPMTVELVDKNDKIVGTLKLLVEKTHYMILLALYTRIYMYKKKHKNIHQHIVKIIL